MKKLILIFFLLLLPLNSDALLATFNTSHTLQGSGIVYDSTNSGATYGAASATTVATPAKSHSINDLLVVVVGWYEYGTNISGISDTAGNNWTSIGKYYVSGTGAMDIYWTYATAASASNVITVSWSPSSVSYRNIAVFRFTGSASSPFDASSTGYGLDSNFSTTAVTTSAALMVAGFYTADSLTLVAGSGFTLGPQGSYFGTEYKIATLTGSQNATATRSGGVSTNYLGMHASFKLP